MDQENWDARVEQSVVTCILLYASNYGGQGAVTRETVVGMATIWEERWVDLNLEAITGSHMEPWKAQKHLWIETMVGNIVGKRQGI